MNASTPPRSDAPKTTTHHPRRHFLARLATITIGGLVALFPFVAGLGVLFHPLRRRTPVDPVEAQSDEAMEFVRVCPLDAVPDDGVPRPFVVINGASDAWTRTEAQRVGMVFLARTDSDGKPQVSALSATCPHLGCAVEYDAGEGQFECPCHESGFALDGKKLFGPSLRGLDPLPVRLKNTNGQTDVLVAYQNFRTGIAERTPV